MDLNDATDEVIDTSDTEEKECLEAQKPGYYQRIWGYSKDAGSLRPEMSYMEVDCDREYLMRNRMGFAQPEPRTPSHRKLHFSSGTDRSPGFSRLQISPQGQPPASSTLATGSKPHSTSKSESRYILDSSDFSSLPSSSPLGALNGVRHKMEGSFSSDRLFVDNFDTDATLGGSQDLNSPLMPLGSMGKAPNNLADHGLHNTSCNTNPNVNPIRSACSTLHATPRPSSSHSGSLNHSLDSQTCLSPPLNFPYSPGPDVFSHSPARSSVNGASQRTISWLNPDGGSGTDISIPPDPFAPPVYQVDSSSRVMYNGPTNDSQDVQGLSRDSVSSPGPVSPVHSSARVEPEPDMFRSMSPLTPPPPEQPPAHRTSMFPSPSLPLIIPPDPDPPGRAYQLRQRRPQQVNPFEYDKKMYKHQLRDMPEAIVRDPTMGREGRRKERYEEESQARGDWNDEEGDDGDEEWRRKEKRKENQKRKEAAAERLRELGLVMSSSEEDPMEVDGAKEMESGAEKKGKKNKTVRKVRKFPMVLESGEPNSSTSSGPPSLAAQGSTEPLRPRPRPRPIFRRPSPSPSPSARRSPASASAGPVDHDFNLPFDAGMDDGGVPDTVMDWPDVGDEDDTPAIIDDADDGMEKRTRGRSTSGLPDEGDSDIQMLDHTDENDRESSKHRSSDSHTSGSNSIEMTEKDRKRLRALGRMMPAAHRNKLLQWEGDKSRQKEKRRLRRQDDGEEDQDVALQPGHGRKRIVSPSSRDPKRYEIKGDTETETESSDDAASNDHEVIAVDDDESEGAAERMLEESDDAIDNDDLHTWLAPDFMDIESSAPPNAPRTRRPDYERDRPRGGDLIDRMLQRTKRVGQRGPKRVKKRKPEVCGARNPMLDPVTKEARRHGTGGGRQAHVMFPKADGAPGASTPIASRRSKERPLGDQHQEHHAESRQDNKVAKKKKSKHGLAQSGLLIVHADGRKVISGRKRQIINIDIEDEAFHEALAPAGHYEPPHARLHAIDKARRRDNRDVVQKFLAGTNAGIEPDTFGTNTIGGQGHGHVTLDFDIPLLPSGLAFGPESYVGKGRLFDLIAILKGDVEPGRPLPLTILERQIEPDVPMADFSPLLAAAYDQLYDTSTAPVEGPEMPLMPKAAEVMMHSLCHLVSFRALRADVEEFGLLAATLVEQTEHLVGRINNRLEELSADGHNLDHRSFTLYWFVLELQLRVSSARWRQNKSMEGTTSPATDNTERYAVLLVRRLLEFGLSRSMRPVHAHSEPLDSTSLNVRTLELWTCVFHIAPLLPSTANNSPASTPPLWKLIEAAMKVQSNKPDSQLDASERIWRTLFSLCAVSQFSPHGLTTTTLRLEPYWPMVLKALNCIRLTADEHLDHSKPAATLQKRDAYVQMVITRCFLLCVRWNWRLNDADGVFHELCAIFRSRNFSNLLGEPSDFPTFIRDRNESLFYTHEDHETAFGLFLKLIVRAAKDFPDTADTRRIRNIKLGKLLSLAVPVGSTSFTKSSPPLGHDLSMLYNRYSAIVIAMYVDPTPANIRTRLQQVRRYINFKDADCDSRAATIRAMMSLATLLRHLELSLDGILSWASDMMMDLVENYNAVDKALGQLQVMEATISERDQLLLSIQLLIGSIRIIIESPTMNPPMPTTNPSGSIPAKYPDPAFLQGAWINRVFAPACSLDSDRRTGLEVRKCVQSFLAARSAIIPHPPPPNPPLYQQESQESQDEYGDEGLDLNDPAVLAILDKLEGAPDENYATDARVAEIIDQSVSTSIYRLVCKHFSSDFFDGRLPGTPCSESDQWIDCWVGCASVVVLNRRRDWTWYFDLARAAWESIRDQFWRRRMCLKFMLTVLHLAPSAYTSLGDRFLDVWFQSIVSPAVTIEHEFTTRLFLVDGLQHFLFKNVRRVADLDKRIFALDLHDFELIRHSLIDVVLLNITEGLEGSEMVTEAARYIPLVKKMLDTLREHFEYISQAEARRSKYAALCTSIFSSIRRHPTLMQEQQLRDALNWGDF